MQKRAPPESAFFATVHFTVARLVSATIGNDIEMSVYHLGYLCSEYNSVNNSIRACVQLSRVDSDRMEKDSTYL